MIEKILPTMVAVTEAFDDPPEARLLPAEERVISRAAARRRREFTTVRWCARRALADFGIAPSPLLPGERGAPEWPVGIVGSMTHCDGYRAAVVARDDDVRALGIDAEPNEPLPDGILSAIALPSELRRHHRLSGALPRVHVDRLLFSAKESVYKAWFPLTHRRLGFEDADIKLADKGVFVARILVGATPEKGIPGPRFAGRWLAVGGLLVTAVVELAEPPVPL